MGVWWGGDIAASGRGTAPYLSLGSGTAQSRQYEFNAIIRWWLLDKTPGQRATDRFVGLIEKAPPLAPLLLQMPPLRAAIVDAGELVGEALFDDNPRLEGPRH